MNEDLKAAPVTDAGYLRLLAERLRGGLVSILTIANNPKFIADRLDMIAEGLEPAPARGKVEPITLKVEMTGIYRCTKCEQMQPAGPMIYLPDGVGEFGDTGINLVAVMRSYYSACNSRGRGWCVPCVKRIIAANKLGRFFKFGDC